MAPAKPPLPTCSYLPFQPETGSHTSNLISESLVGFATPATRQNAGMSARGGAPGGGLGGLNSPAGTEVADVIVALERESEARFSHGRCAKTCAGLSAVIMNSAKRNGNAM